LSAGNRFHKSSPKRDGNRADKTRCVTHISANTTTNIAYADTAFPHITANAIFRPRLFCKQRRRSPWCV
jgi:hypothetical protein